MSDRSWWHSANPYLLVSYSFVLEWMHEAHNSGLIRGKKKWWVQITGASLSHEQNPNPFGFLRNGDAFNDPIREGPRFHNVEEIPWWNESSNRLKNSSLLLSIYARFEPNWARVGTQLLIERWKSNIREGFLPHLASRLLERRLAVAPPPSRQSMWSCRSFAGCSNYD